MRGGPVLIVVAHDFDFDPKGNRSYGGGADDGGGGGGQIIHT